MSITNRQQFNFHKPSSNLPLYQKGAHSTDIKTFNSLPQNIKNKWQLLNNSNQP